MPLRDTKYKSNQSIISVIGIGANRQIRVVTMNCLRTTGIEDDKAKTPEKKENENDRKLSQSISRTKRKIFELALCNPWELFGTLTLDSQKYDRTQLSKYREDFAQWIRNLNKKHKCKIKYLLIPELHKDNMNWHMHGFFNELPFSLLNPFQVGDKMGKQIADKVLRGDIVYNWEGYQNKFGFCSLEPLRNHEAASKYVTKYITKDLLKSVTELHAHTYFPSHQLNRAITVKKGILLKDISYDFENEYCKIKTFPYSESLYQELCSSIDSEYC